MPDTGAQQPSHLWSLEEIEALLSEHKTQPSAQPEPERSPLPGIEGDGPSIALDKAKDAVEEETFEPLLPLFEETGDIFDPRTARRYRRHILTEAGYDEPMAQYVRFRGAVPDATPLMRRYGLAE